MLRSIGSVAVDGLCVLLLSVFGFNLRRQPTSFICPLVACLVASLVYLFAFARSISTAVPSRVAKMNNMACNSNIFATVVLQYAVHILYMEHKTLECGRKCFALKLSRSATSSYGSTINSMFFFRIFQPPKSASLRRRTFV